MPDYAYINARIRSMEGDLLNEGQLREILSFRELSAAAGYLKKTTYGFYFSEWVEGPLIYTMDTTFRTSLSVSMKKILSFFKGDDSTLIDILLSRWDLFNIKTLVRGKLNNIPSDEALSATVPAGSLDEGMLREVYKQPSVQAMLDMLFTLRYTYVSSLKKIRNLNEGNLFKGEVELENAFFKDALSRIRSSRERGLNSVIVEDTIRMLIDRYNLIASIRMAEGGLHSEDAIGYFIEGGSLISLEIYKKIVKGRDVSECMAMIDRAVWKMHWDRFSAQSHITNPLLQVERWMDYEILNHAKRLPHKDPLHIGLVISYIWRKTNEVINLRTMIRGIHYNLPQGEVESLILI